MSRPTYAAPPSINRLQKKSLVVGIVGLALCALGGVFNPAQFFRSYLIGFLLWAGVTLGCLAILMLQHVTGGAWGVMIRRPLESATRTLPLIALFFVPILLGLRKIYPWTQPGAVTGHQAMYLNASAFLIRAAIYFACWGALTYLLNRWSLEQDATSDSELKRKLALLSAGGLAVYVLTVSFAGIDWVMSLTPHWYSSIFGMIIIGGQALAAMALTIAVLALLAQSEPISEAVQPRHFHDLGKLLLAFVMLWAYFAFSQLMIIWAGNLPEEIPWYLNRMHGGWGAIGLLVVLFHFAVPFALLLSRNIKRNARTLGLLALGIFAARWVDLVWLIAPEYSTRLRIHWMDLLAPVGLGGIWLAFYFWQLQSRPLLPIGDSYLQKALEHGEE
jgi:hypothetical protein